MIPQPGLAAVCCVWAFLLAVGFGGLLVYTQTPADRQPAATETQTADGVWRLVLGVHPRCPCTHATVSELERLLTRCEGLRCVAYVYRPRHDPSFADTVLVKRLRGLPGCDVRGDGEGEELARLGIVTSGGCLLYDGFGVLRFSGGITPSRGHEGLNLGYQAIAALLAGRPTTVSEAPVYGCQITSRSGGDA